MSNTRFEIRTQGNQTQVVEVQAHQLVNPFFATHTNYQRETVRATFNGPASGRDARIFLRGLELHVTGKATMLEDDDDETRYYHDALTQQHQPIDAEVRQQ